MNREQFLKGFKFLNIAYNKEFTDEQVIVWYDFFKQEDYEIFRIAVKNIIKTNKYMPSISELVDEINYVKIKEIQDYMNNCGQLENFKSDKKFYYTFDENVENFIINILDNGFTIEQIKSGIRKAYDEYVEQQSSDNKYNPKVLFGLGQNVVYFINS